MGQRVKPKRLVGCSGHPSIAEFCEFEQFRGCKNYKQLCLRSVLVGGGAIITKEALFDAIMDKTKE